MVKIDKAKSIKISHKLDVSYVSDWENHRTKFPLYPLSRKPCLMTAKSIEFWRLGTETHCSHLTEEIRYCLAKTLLDTQRLRHLCMGLSEKVYEYHDIPPNDHFKWENGD